MGLPPRFLPGDTLHQPDTPPPEIWSWEGENGEDRSLGPEVALTPHGSRKCRSDLFWEV